MKIKYINALLTLCTTLMLASCADTDYSDIQKSGSPVINAQVPQAAEMGDSIEVKVNCSDSKGINLSTLKAEMLYSGETVGSDMVRTATPGEYTVKLHVPFLRFIPNGTAQVRLTLQNVTTMTTTQNIDINVTRPHFDNLQFVDADGKKHDMQETSDYNYECSYGISDNAFKGFFETADGKYHFGWGDNDIAENGQGLLAFQSNATGNVKVTFNTCDFNFGPQEELNITPLMFRNADGQNIYTGILTQGSTYRFTGDEAVTANNWYYDSDFFTRNADGTFTFNALTGTYTIKAVFEENGFRIHAGDVENPLKLNADGTGALWIIGANMFGKPNYSHAQGWWTDTDHAMCMAPVADKVYQVTLTVGRQLKVVDDVDFKFFGQAGWGTEFKASGDHALTTDNPYFRVNEGDGNIHLRDGVTLKKGDTYKITIDLTAGCANGKMYVEKTGDPVINLTADAPLYIGDFTQGQTYQFVGDDNMMADDWFYDSDYFIRNQDGSLTFNAVNGKYAVKALFDKKGFRICRMDDSGTTTASLSDEGTGAIWLIGDNIFGKPDYSEAQGWWTDPDHALCLAEVSKKVFQLTLTVGKQLKPGNSVNFKFFGQAGWGTEFKGTADSHWLTTSNPYFLVGDGNGHDNGNIYLPEDMVLNDGETYVFTIDCTKGMAPATLSVKKK